MLIRESRAYNEDLETGDRIELLKYKPIDVPVLGIGLVQLFDAETGEKTYEAKTENIINNFTSKQAYMDYFYMRIKGDPAPSSNNYYGSFRNIVLTDHSGAEDANTMRLLGNVIGWADKVTAYAGTDIQRGTINLTESTLDADGSGLIHFVFDFPTSAANGTFQSLFWVGSLYNAIDTQKSVNIQTGVNLSTIVNTSYIALGSKLALILSASYTTSNSNYNFGSANYCLILDPTNNYAITKTYNLGTILGSNFTGNSIVWGGSDSNSLIFINLSTGVAAVLDTSTDAVTNITSGIPTTMNKPLLIGNILYLHVYSTSGCIVSKFSITGGVATKIKDISITQSYSSNYTQGFKVIYGFPALNFSSSYYYFVVNDTIVASNYYVNSNYEAMTSNDKNYIPNGGSYVTNQWVSSVKVSNEMCPIGAQTLLAAPVTKTPTNTMKIQYDFNVQKVL